VPAAVAALAAASLLAPFAPLYDPWAWLVWGREIAGLDLDTEAGPSWKPLAAMIAALLAPAGDAAPSLWLFVARAGWLAAAALAYRLAWRLMFPARTATAVATRFAPRRVRLARNLAGALAALGVVLLADPFTPWMHQFAGGLSEPLLVALVLGAVDRELSGHRGQALALGFAAALLRPEVWPFLLAYGVWLRRREPRLRRWLAAAAIALPALWLVPDLIGSGSLFTGAERAREATGAPLPEALESLGRSFELPLAGLWAGAVAAVVSARQHDEREILGLAAGAAAWVALVAALAAAGFAGLPRFAAPAAAIACVLGGVGLVRLLAAIDGMRLADPRRRPAIALAGVVVAALAVQATIRAADVPAQVEEASEYARGIDELSALADAADHETLTSCRPLTTTDFLTVPPLAWDLELAMARIAVRTETAPDAGVAIISFQEASPARTAIEGRGRPLAERGRWAAYVISCPGPAEAPAAL
jgi:hypothetical protein